MMNHMSSLYKIGFVHTKSCMLNIMQKILVHGDKELLPLFSDRTNHSNSKQIIDDIKDLIIYTGYVCDDSIKKHIQKNNFIYVSTGLNKQGGRALFKEIKCMQNIFQIILL